MVRYQFERFRTAPVLLKGATYDGVKADWITAPAVTWDGTRFVMNVVIWNIAQQKWHSIFLTSSNLLDWTYIQGSRLAPRGSAYIRGNGGLQFYKGKYFFAYNEGVGVTLDWSADLLNWTTIAAELPQAPTGADPQLNINPVNGKMELWYVPGNRQIFYADTDDGFTWTDRGLYFPGATWASPSGNLGEPCAFYVDGKRYVVVDANQPGGGYPRAIGMLIDKNRDGNFTTYGTCLAGSPFHAWEKAQVFDGNPVGPFDLGDGPMIYMFYSGGDVIDATDLTNSSIGCVRMSVSQLP